eukprot:11948730-Alexandrium_andersonii.AAC.1
MTTSHSTLPDWHPRRARAVVPRPTWMTTTRRSPRTTRRSPWTMTRARAPPTHRPLRRRSASSSRRRPPRTARLTL